jgi:hypothetical protein
LENPDEPARAHRNERYTPGRARESAESRSPPWLARSVARPCLRSSAALDAAGEDGVNMTIIVTGAAGFVGYFTAERLLKRGEAVIGVDDFNAYYEPGLKEARAARLSTHARFSMARMDVADAPAFAGLVKESGADKIVHLAAQAGVRYSMQAPFAYERSNIAGHLSVLEACRNARRSSTWSTHPPARSMAIAPSQGRFERTIRPMRRCRSMLRPNDRASFSA